jgi:hypothetical protein
MGGPTVLTAIPAIEEGIDGQVLIIQGTSDVNTVTLQDESRLDGAKLKLGVPNRILGKGGILVLTYDTADGTWYEVSYTSN